jgi:hypothetical protein
MKWDPPHDLNSTCHTSLYNQDFPSVLELCPMTINPEKEKILQIQTSNYLAQLPEPITGNVICLNNPNIGFFLSKKINQIHVSLNCQTLLCKHIIISDTSNKPVTDLKHYH